MNARTVEKAVRGSNERDASFINILPYKSGAFWISEKEKLYLSTFEVEAFYNFSLLLRIKDMLFHKLPLLYTFFALNPLEP